MTRLAAGGHDSFCGSLRGRGVTHGFVFDSQLLHFIEQGLVIDLQQRGSLLSIPASGIQRGEDSVGFSELLGLGHLFQNRSADVVCPYPVGT